MDNADRQAQQTGDALLLSEFGATDDVATIGRTVEAAEAHMVSLAVLALLRVRRPDHVGAPASRESSIEADRPPSGDNVKEGKLGALSRGPIRSSWRGPR